MNLSSVRIDNKKLGIAAIVMAFLVLVSGESHNGNGVTVDPKELAYKVENELDHVSAVEVAHWIMSGKTDFRLIDLREASAYSRYHIPGAENVSLTSLVKSHYDKKQSIVLYSEGGVHSAQAMFLLWMQGYRNVLMLKGGLNEWNADVLHPVITSTKASGAMRDSLDEIKKMSLYFGGAANLHTPGNSIESNSGREREKVRDEC